MKDSLLILSGGMDSTTMLYDYRDRIALAVGFDYGSNHNGREIPMARLHCQRLGIPYMVVPLDFMPRFLKSSLLAGADAVPTGQYDEQNMQSTVVPFRNGIMLSVAAGIAESRGLRHLMMANHSGDHSIYPDCRPAFVQAMSQAVSAGTYEGIDLVAPYTGLTKTDIALRGKLLGIDYSETYSCYKGGEHHCGQCATCLERRQALREAGIADTTLYDSDTH
ncbi:MAG: 7-cyano-7-deazaguanine synthase QueC [Bacteroidales bacterium]|nr:7-cyano-7-deazaguanine synthase QueC [Bacteroidales bacterium]